MDSAAYARQLKQLLPRGALWRLDPDSWLSKLLLAIAGEFARIDARGGDLVREWDPRTALETLPEWERVLGVVPPDGATATDRQLAITALMVARGGATPAYFEALAASLGFVATVVETTANTWRMDVDLALTTVPYSMVTWEFRVGTARTPDRLGGRSVLELERVINLARPAHTVISYNYV